MSAETNLPSRPFDRPQSGLAASGQGGHRRLPALRLPVVAAPMFLISGPDLVLAACRAGIVGAFPTPNARPIEVLDQWM